LRIRNAKTGINTTTNNLLVKDFYIQGLIIPGESVEKFADCRPIKIEPKGNYGVAIIWSDGHYADIFPYNVLREIAVDLSSKLLSHAH